MYDGTTMNLVVRSHFINALYREDEGDFGDDYIGIFGSEFQAESFINELPKPDRFEDVSNLRTEWEIRNGIIKKYVSINDVDKYKASEYGEGEIIWIKMVKVPKF